MSWLSKAYGKVMSNKTAGKLVGAAYPLQAPFMAAADLVSKKPFFKGAAQGTRAGLGASALLAGGMLAAPTVAGGSAANVSNPAFAGMAGEASTVAPTAGFGSQVMGMLPDLVSTAIPTGESKTDRLAQMKAERKQAEQAAYNRLLQQAKGA